MDMLKMIKDQYNGKQLAPCSRRRDHQRHQRHNPKSRTLLENTMGQKGPIKFRSKVQNLKILATLKLLKRSSNRMENIDVNDRRERLSLRQNNDPSIVANAMGPHRVSSFTVIVCNTHRHASRAHNVPIR